MRILGRPEKERKDRTDYSEYIPEFEKYDHVKAPSPDMSDFFIKPTG